MNTELLREDERSVRCVCNLLRQRLIEEREKNTKWEDKKMLNELIEAQKTMKMGAK